MECEYCARYSHERTLLNCPFEELFDDLIAAIFCTQYDVGITPDNFVIYGDIIEGYLDELLLFKFNCDNYELIAYFGHEIKKESYKTILKEMKLLVSTTDFSHVFPPVKCLNAHGIDYINYDA